MSFLNVNAKRLLASAAGTKPVELGVLLRTLYWPALVVLTETSGTPGKDDLRDRLGPDIARRYDTYWAFRPMMSAKGAVRSARGVRGGGVALLVNKWLPCRLAPTN